MANITNSFNTQLKHKQLQALSIVFTVTATLSLIGSSSIILLSIKRKVVTRRSILPIFHIFVADLLVSIGIIVGAASSDEVVNEHNLLITEYRAYCVTVTMFTTACYMATFLLTINYALQSYIMVSEKLEHPHRPVVENMLRCCNWEKWFPIFSWTFPAALALFITFIDSGKNNKDGHFYLNDDICTWCFPLFFYDNTASCSSKQKGKGGKIDFDFYYFYKATFLTMIAITLIVVLVLFYFVFTRFRRLLVSGGMLGNYQRSQVKKLRNRTIMLFGVLVFCWIVPLTLGLISLAQSFFMRKFFAMYVIEALTSPLQGFLNSIVYGWFSIRFHTVTNEEQRPLIHPCSSPTFPEFSEPE